MVEMECSRGRKGWKDLRWKSNCLTGYKVSDCLLRMDGRREGR